MILLDVLIIVLVAKFLLKLIKRILWINRAEKMTANIPGPKPWPIIGNADIFAKVKTTEDAIKLIDELFIQYSKPPQKLVRIWAGSKLVLLLGSPKHIETILSSPDALEKDDIYRVFRIVGNGLFSRNGQEWQDLRKPLNKLLTKKMVESNLDMFHEKALKLCQVLNKHAISGKSFDFRPYATNISADTVTVSNFGYDLNELEKEENNLHELFKKMEHMSCEMIMNPLNHMSSLYAKLSSGRRNLENHARIYWNLVSKMLYHRLYERLKLGENIDAKPVYFSDVFMQNAIQLKLSREATGRLATDFFIAGYDTSATTLSFIMLMLAMFPEHQEAVYKEQLDILGDDPEVAPTWEQLSKMNYLTRVIKEVMRLYGAVGIFRKLTKDVDIGECILPKGCTAIVTFYALHRDPNFWTHPHEFYPDHFLPEAVDARPKGVYFPFSWGPRSCPGSTYAMATNRTIVSTIIRKYKFETDLTFDKLEYKYSLLLEVSKGYMMKIKPRN